MSFTSGAWSFDPWPCTSACHRGKFSGWNYSGNLKDTSADGHDVFAHARIDGYNWAPRVYWKGHPGQQTRVGQKIYASDPAQRGQLEVCTDRGTLVPDSCRRSAWFRR